MKITWQGRQSTGRFLLQAHPEAYDAIPPIDSLYLDRDMPQINNDLFGVASVLTFGRYCEGSLDLPRAISPETAAAIEEFLRPAKVRVANVEYEPFANSLGDGYVYLDVSGIHQLPTPNQLGLERISSVSVLDATEYAGSLSSMSGVALGTNAKVIGNFCTKPYQFLPQLAVALLFAESLRARTIVVDDDLISDCLLRSKLVSLLSSCKILLLSTSELSNLRMIDNKDQEERYESA